MVELYGETFRRLFFINKRRTPYLYAAKCETQLSFISAHIQINR
jgi:hypothetical protein